MTPAGWAALITERLDLEGEDPARAALRGLVAQLNRATTMRDVGRVIEDLRAARGVIAQPYVSPLEGFLAELHGAAQRPGGAWMQEYVELLRWLYKGWPAEPCAVCREPVATNESPVTCGAAACEREFHRWLEVEA